jgi:Ca-activated chloride channel family protein
MQDQHHSSDEAAARASRAPRAVLVFLLVGAVIIGAVLALRSGAETASCSGALALSVEAAPGVAPAVRAAAAEYEETEPSVEGQCLTVQVSARAANETASMLAGGWSDEAGSRPDVWIPDSTSWLDLARLAKPARALVPASAPTVATSPVVIAMPRVMADALDWPDKQLSWSGLQKNKGTGNFWAARGHPGWGPFRVVLPDPQASSAGAHAVLSMVAASAGRSADQLTIQMFRSDTTIQKAILTVERDSQSVPASDEALLSELRGADADGRLPEYLSAAPMSELAVFDYNRGLLADGKPTPPKQQLVAQYPPDGLDVQEIPYVTFAATSENPARAAAADGFLDALLGDAGQTTLAEHGLRTSARTNPKLTLDAGFLPELRTEPAPAADPVATAAAIQTFRAVHRRGTALAVIDVSGSMNTQVPQPAGGSKTRLQLVVEAFESAIPLVAPDSGVGLWEFATKLDGDTDYRELVPIGPMNELVDGRLRSTAVIERARAMKPLTDTGLYDTALAAFDAMTAAYTPNRVNQVVLMTDGKNDDPGSITLDQLVADLERKYDPDRPVHLITIGYGQDADMQALSRISAATKSKSYPALDPNSISRVIIEALSSE